MKLSPKMPPKNPRNNRSSSRTSGKSSPFSMVARDRSLHGFPPPANAPDCQGAIGISGDSVEGVDITVPIKLLRDALLARCVHRRCL